MTLIFSDKFAINPQSAEGGGGGAINNVDFSKLNYQNYYTINSSSIPVLINGYYTKFNSPLIVNSGGAEYSANSGVVDFSQPFEINCEFIAPTTAGGAIFGNCYSNQYFRCPSAEFQANGTTTIWTAVSTDGETWTNSFSFTTSEVPTVLGGRYIINHKYDGSNYTVSVTYNENTVTKTQVLSTPPYFKNGSSATSSYFGFGGTANNANLEFKDGKIWIGNTYIKQSGVLTWGCEGK